MLDWRRQFEDVEERVNRSMWWRHTPSPGWSEESAEFYSQYSRQIGGGGRLEDQLSHHNPQYTSAKTVGDSFDSHIAEIRGKSDEYFLF